MKLVKFFAPWCGPCKMMAPVVDEFVAEHPELEYQNVNIEEDGELAQKYGIMSIPTILLFDEEENVIAKILGFSTKQALVSKLEEHL